MLRMIMGTPWGWQMEKKSGNVNNESQHSCCFLKCKWTTPLEALYFIIIHVDATQSFFFFCSDSLIIMYILWYRKTKVNAPITCEKVKKTDNVLQLPKCISIAEKYRKTVYLVGFEIKKFLLDSTPVRFMNFGRFDWGLCLFFPRIWFWKASMNVC